MEGGLEGSPTSRDLAEREADTQWLLGQTSRTHTQVEMQTVAEK